MIAEVGDIVMPGYRIVEAEQIAASNKKVVLGPGLRRHNDNVLSCKAGILRKKAQNTFWIDSYQKRYIPNKGEAVVGIVIAKGTDIYRVDIGASEPASLSCMAFEGATKKNRPDINVGDIVFAKLLIANPDLESELVCVDSLGKKDKLGQLTDGFVFNCSINLIRKILSENCPLLKSLHKEFHFELAAGMNGRIWIKGKSVKETIALGNAILATEFTSNEDISKLSNNIGNILAGFDQ